MKRFLKYLGLIVFVTLIFMIILDQAYSYVFRNSEPRSKIQKVMQLKDAHYDVAFFGSSRTENHIDCELIRTVTGKSCINFGISGGSLADMNVLMKLLAKNNVSYNKALVQVDYNFNSENLSPSFRAQLVPFIQDSVIKKALAQEKSNLSYTYVPFYRYLKNDKVIGFREFFANIIDKKPKTNMDVGFAPKIGIGNQVAGTFSSSFKEKNKAIESIKSHLSLQEIPLVFFTAPYCKNIGNREIGIQMLKERIPDLLDYSTIYDNHEDFFFNCGHLNIEGARDFSGFIAKEILSLPASNN